MTGLYEVASKSLQSCGNRRMRVGRHCGKTGSGDKGRMGDIGSSMYGASDAGSNYTQVGYRSVDSMVLTFFTLTGSNLGIFWGGSNETPSTPLASVSEMPRLERVLVSAALCLRRGHFFMWLTADLVEELTSFFRFCQPHLQESNEAILSLIFQ